MLTGFKEQLFSKWHPMRWFALTLAAILGYNWFVYSAPVSGFLSLFFLFQTVTNTGCLAGRCGVPTGNYNEEDIDNIEYEEINTKKL